MLIVRHCTSAGETRLGSVTQRPGLQPAQCVCKRNQPIYGTQTLIRLSWLLRLPDTRSSCVPPQCAGPTLHFDDLTNIVPIDPFTGTSGTAGSAGYARLASNYYDSRLTWTNWDVIDGVLWGNTISNPKQARSHQLLIHSRALQALMLDLDLTLKLAVLMTPLSPVAVTRTFHIPWLELPLADRGTCTG